LTTGKAKPRAVDSPLVASAEAFDATLKRFAALAEGLRKGALDSQRNLEKAAESLKQVAACEEELQAHAQALTTALAGARDAQQAQAETVRVRALEIQARGEELARLMRGFEAIGKDAAALNASAQALAARKRTADEMVKDGELLAGLDELQERMTAVLAAAEQLSADARGADFEDLSQKIDSLRQQILAARNKISLLKEALVRAAPPVRAS
jgi:chromosome segregation ATPase